MFVYYKIAFISLLLVRKLYSRMEQEDNRWYSGQVKITTARAYSHVCTRSERQARPFAGTRLVGVDLKYSVMLIRDGRIVSRLVELVLSQLGKNVFAVVQFLWSRFDSASMVYTSTLLLFKLCAFIVERVSCMCRRRFCFRFSLYFIIIACYGRHGALRL